MICSAVAVNGKEVVLNQENDFEEVQTFDKLNVTTRKVSLGFTRKSAKMIYCPGNPFLRTLDPTA